ncbi:MAG: Hsp20/alpha crystallin family protein [Opitutales bacterium]
MSLLDTILPTASRRAAYSDAGPSGPVLKPVYEVRETGEAYGLTVYLPGVAKDGLDLTADATEIRVTGRRTWRQPEGWTSLYRESADAPYELVLAHDNAIDADKIAAELNDGVLRLSLPKAEAIKPRKIAVT